MSYTFPSNHKVFNYQSDITVKSIDFSAVKKNWLKWLFTTGLVLIVFLSAIAVVYVRAENRLLFSELQNLKQIEDDLHIEWGQLLLEQSTLVTQARVEAIAINELKMQVPLQNETIVLKD